MKLINSLENSKIVKFKFSERVKKMLFMVVLLVLTVTQTVSAQTEPMVGFEIGNHGYSQVYYVDENGDKKYVTDDMFSSTDPMREGDYVTYMSKIRGSWHIFLYHIPTGTKTQLTATGNNVNPEIEDGLVVWESWVESESSESTWQIFLYDGTGVKQLTTGDTSVYPDIEDGYIVMARRDSNGSWRSVLYSINDKTFAQVSIAQDAKHPKLVGKKIFHGDKEFPLITDDIYLLGFDKLPATERPPVTEEDILQEINGPDASSSAEIAAPDKSFDPEDPTTENSGSQAGTPEADLTGPQDNQ